MGKEVDCVDKTIEENAKVMRVHSVLPVHPVPLQTWFSFTIQSYINKDVEATKL